MEVSEVKGLRALEDETLHVAATAFNARLRNLEDDKETITVEDDAETIVKILQDRGWEASTVSQSALSDVVKVGPEGLMKCVDGRLSTTQA